MQRKIKIHRSPRLQMPVTRVCVTAMISGVPVGAQIAWLSSNNSGWPFEVTGVAAVMNCAVTLEPLAAGGVGRAQPTATGGAARVTVGAPFSLTRGIGSGGCAL